MRGISPKFLRWNNVIIVLLLALTYPLVQAKTDTLSMQQRMNKLDEQSDIHFVLNNLVKEKITEFGKQKKLIALCMADGELHFPLIEAEFSKSNIPLELKYITVMESHVNPAAGHSDGPAGLWQITNGTGKVMGLRNDKYIDDRRTTQASTKAVSAYFAKLYNIYGDWQLAITAYQIGNGTLDKIIAKHGKKEYWSLRPYLPKFASDYMAKYFAVCYVMENYQSFGIVPYAGKYNASKLDTVHITQALGFERMAQALGIQKSEISKLNPQFKQHFFPGENGIYAVLTAEAAKAFREDPKKVYNFAVKKITVQNQSAPTKKSTKKPAKKKKK